MMNTMHNAQTNLPSHRQTSVRLFVLQKARLACGPQRSQYTLHLYHRAVLLTPAESRGCQTRDPCLPHPLWDAMCVSPYIPRAIHRPHRAPSRCRQLHQSVPCRHKL